MDDEQTQQDTVDEALLEVPEQVQDFMWSNLYEIIIDSIQEALKLTAEQRENVKYLGYDLLMGLKTMPDAAEELAASGMPPELVAKVLYALNDELITRAAEITEYYSTDETGGEENSENTTESSVSAPSPADMIARLNQSLTKPVVTPPTKRDYGTEKPVAPAAPSGIRAIDPYRETPEIDK